MRIFSKNDSTMNVLDSALGDPSSNLADELASTAAKPAASAREFAIVIALAATTALSAAGCTSKDAAPDAAAPDAERADAGPSCSDDSECDNGFFCDGLETCTNNRCVSGDSIVCDDGIACTTDTCSDERRECVYTPRDADGDGRVDITCLDANGDPMGDDCDDNDAARFPGNIELCDADNHDEDCDDTTYGRIDADGDGFDDARCCNGSNCGTDCDDVRANVNPFVTEACDGIDNNCNGLVDDGVLVQVYADNDGDGFGDPAMPMMLCAGAAHVSTLNTDCDDTDPARNPAQLEVCDGKDNDCDPQIDEEFNEVNWYPDTDNDGFGDPAGPIIVACVPPANYSLSNTDCDDSKGAVSPVAAELCDGIDNDCNGLADFSVGVNDFEDDDGDGLLDPACIGGTDCDDNDAATGPAGIEQCDGRDNDCDGMIDEGAVDTVWYRDNDGDGFGSAVSGTVISCQAPPGFAAPGGDCDDADSERSPGRNELCDNIDQDCDGAIDEEPAAELSCTTDRSTGQALCINGACALACNPGADNCDGDFVNGCEAILAADMNNCGACGNSCTGPNQRGTCTAGTCDCNPGWADCNGDPSDGCEINTDFNTSNCGGCGSFCGFNNGLANCDAGNCTLSACLPGFDNCDGNLLSGCEQSVQTDTQCGSCNTDCTSLPGATGGTCFGGGGGDVSCQISSCDPNRSDCDGDSSNGCEINTDTDPNSCGNCFTRCDQSNQTGTCTGGACVCQTGQLDCDGDPNNGCEAKIDDDPGRCGSCVNNCFLQVSNGDAQCTAGTCGVQCQPGWDNCTGDMDPLTCETRVDDVDNCGACGNACVATNGDPFCNFGATLECRANCYPGFSDCDADPTTCESDTSSDPLNCGACGNVCGVGGACINNQCDRIKDVAVGGNFTCALRDRGTVVCWGDNSLGQLGNGNFMPSFAPVVVVGLPQATEISAGARHACAITTSGLYCWGDNATGQVGSGALGGNFGVPQQVNGIVAGRLALGEDHSCALSSTGQVYCWGNNAEGAAGQSPIGLSFATPTVVASLPGTYFDIASGVGFSCARDDLQNVFCWGQNMEGQLGNGAVLPGTPNESAQPVAGVNGSFTIAAGDRHVCSVRAVVSNIVNCWGADDRLQLGDDETIANSSLPVESSALSINEVSLMSMATCALDQFSAVHCWGDNGFGQLGEGTVGAGHGSPGDVSLGVQIQRLAKSGPGGDHMCALDNNGRLWCWGRNESGQTGIDPGVQDPVMTPMKIVGL